MCVYLCLCTSAHTHTQTHTRLLCLSAPVTVFVELWSCWNGTWTFCHRAVFTETGLVLACCAVFRLCIYVLDDHSNPYHRRMIHVCLLCSGSDLNPSRILFSSFSPPKPFPQKCSRHRRSGFHQPPLIVADQACSGFHSEDATLKLTTSIIIHSYFSNEFV